MPRPTLVRYFPSAPTRADRLHLRDVLRHETTGGLLMLAAAAFAVLWANVAPDSYAHITHLHLGPLSLAHWASDGLLTVFFFVAGLELKRELTEGSLRRPTQAVLPIVAAIAGMLVPAGLYLTVQALAPGGGQAAGWAVPVATDIAFALAVLAIVGSALPDELRSFLLTLAIVDDIGAILIIALVFTASINLVALAGAAALCGVWFLLQRRHVEAWWIYLPLAAATWACAQASGVHATIAGVVLGLLTYCSADDDYDVLDRWEHALTPVSAGVAVPVFALLSAGVRVTGADLERAVTSPVAIGVAVALFLGKPIGAFGGTLLASRLTGSRPRAGLTWKAVAAATQLAGIGFTVALLLAELSFTDPALQQAAKTAVLAGSLASALAGGILVAVSSKRHQARQVRSTAAAAETSR